VGRTLNLFTYYIIFLFHYYGHIPDYFCHIILSSTEVEDEYQIYSIHYISIRYVVIFAI
jgi:hypothetical protein